MTSPLSPVVGEAQAPPVRSRSSVLNKRGEWVPAIPLPYFGLRKECQCGKQFWTADGYRGHYAYAHILGMESDGPPVAAALDQSSVGEGEKQQ